MVLARSPSELAEGNAFPWIVRDRAGAGASSIVFRATHATSGEVAALEVATGAAELRREAELLARVVRRWGPRLLDVGRLPGDALGCASGASFLAIEWAGGRALEPTRVRGDRDHLAAVVAHAVGRALAELHESGVRHGDVKPANVIVGDSQPAWDVPGDRGATLVDFGLAAEALDAPLVGGTPRYFAPETHAGLVGPATDLYALGLTLAEILDPALAAAPDLAHAVRRWEPATRSGPLQWAHALLAPAAGGRPPAAWVADRAGRYLNLRIDAASEARARELTVKRSYLALRARELVGAHEGAFGADLRGAPRVWIEEALAWTAKLGVPAREEPSRTQLVGEATRPTRKTASLDAIGRLRWLMALAGPHAVAWGRALEDQADADLADRLIAVARARPLAAVTLDDLVPATALAGDLARDAGDLARDAGDLARDAGDERSAKGDRNGDGARGAGREALGDARGGARADGAPRERLERTSDAAPASRDTRALRADQDARAALPPRDVEGVWEPGVGAERAARLAGELARAVPDARAVAIAEDDVAHGDAPGAVALALATSLLRAGQVGRAFAALATARSDEADALRAEIARRRADRGEAIRFARRAAKSKRAAPRAQGKATLARLACDAGDLDGALRLLGDAGGTGAAEVRGIVAWRRGTPEAGLSAINLALVQARDDEAVARLEGVRGMLLHARGDAEESAEAFSRAVERATRCGAVVEEATYLTGAAAAATDAGDVGRALESARRAALLWERIGRPRDAARAWLAAAVALATVGASHEANEAAGEAERRARQGGDVRAEAYAAFTRIEVLPPGDDEARALAIRAAAMVEAAIARQAATPAELAEDRVRAAARCLVWGDGALAPASIAELDALAETLAPAARVEWWGARAAAILAAARAPLSSPADELGEPDADAPMPFAPPPLTSAAAGDIVRRLLSLAEARAPLAARGPALDAGAQLARERGDGEAAQRLESARAGAAATLRARTPAAYRACLAQVPWARAGDADHADIAFSAEQVARLESILRALGGRESLRALLTQVLDALVVWTGVERGLLLLRAPDGRLVPRAARNLARRDLNKQQLALSQTLARRALDTGDAVVATDAVAEADVHASVHALRLRSVLAVPLLARGEAIGVVYLDDRARRGAFGPRELAWVRVLAGQAARAIVDARDQVLLRRAARRANHAARRLEVVLAARDAELDVARQELERTRGEPDPAGTRFRYEGILGRSEPMRALLRLVDKVTQSDVPVLVVGESGTGKELVARALHANGPRARRPFVSENCASVPETLLESTLFGHVRGAFTGASSTRAGLFDVADGGTLFLDEIGEMSLAMQSKLLRVLQDGEVRPVGGERARRVDVRILGATHRDLEAMVQRGTFREDLYYRLNVITLRVPPLRERREDIPVLVAHFVETHADRKARVTRAAMDRLVTFPWPGNVRQLENEIRRACLLAEDRIDEDDLSPEIVRGVAGAARAAGLDLRARVDHLEAELLREALKKTAGNQTKAAALLGLSRFGLQKMIKRLNVRP